MKHLVCKDVMSALSNIGSTDHIWFKDIEKGQYLREYVPVRSIFIFAFALKGKL
jgi:hypothetical protein